jgi:hypothetical protein
MTEAPDKIVTLRGMDPKLWAAVRDQAKAEGMYIRAWVERALRRELEQEAQQS